MSGQRKALIIANDKYQHEGLRNLRAPAADAAGLRRVLGDPRIGEFAVQVVHNEPAHVIHAEIEELFLDSRLDDVLLLHFSCHGLKSESGELFFAASNTRPDRLGSTAVSADFVQKCMRTTRSRSVVLLLDCCYGGAFAQGVTVRASGDVNALDNFQQRSGGGRGRVVITASSAMEYAFEGSQLADDRRRRRQPSAFTAALVEGLGTGDADRDQDGWVSLDELYDYVFDRVREQNPHQTPGRHVELAGEMYIARNPRQAPGRRHSGSGQQTEVSSPAVPPPAQSEVVTAIESKVSSVPTEVEQEPSAPEPEESANIIKVNPITVTPWRERIGAGQALVLAPALERFPSRAIRLITPSMLAAGWFAYAAWVAAAHSPNGELWIGASIGFLSYIFGILRGLFPDINNAGTRPLNSLIGASALALYVASIFSGSAHNFFSNRHLTELAWIAGAILLRYIPSSSIRRASNRSYSVNTKTQKLRLQDAHAALQTRWLTNTGNRMSDLASLELLYEIPAARFAALQGEYLRFLIVAGSEVLLVASHTWCTIKDPEIAAEVREWKEKLAPIRPKTLVILDQVYKTEKGDPMPFRAAEEDVTYAKADVTFVTEEMFSDVAGSYLLPGAHRLDGSTLHSIYSVLGITTDQVAAMRTDTPSPDPSATGPAQGDSSVRETWADVEHDQLPVVDTLDSVTADAMRHAETLRGLGNALDTRLIFLGLAQVHVRGRWDRIWLKCARSPEDIARQKSLRDPVDHPREQWQDTQLTATCANSLRSAARIAVRYGLPITPGVLALGLVSNPRTAAAKALGVGDTIEHDELLELIEDELLGFSGARDDSYEQ